MTSSISLRLSGPSISPGNVKSKELAEILEAMEDMIASEVIKENPKIKKDEIVIGLCEIGNNSVGLKFKYTHNRYVLACYLALTAAIQSNHFEELTPQSIKSLRTISSFTQKHQCIAKFTEETKKDILAEITPDTIIPTAGTIKGETTIYGKVIRVGGKKPRATVETIDGVILYCDLDVDLAKILGHKLYTTVTLHGNAVWDHHNFSLEEFEIKEVDDFGALNPDDSCNQMRAIIGKFFKKITDVPGFVTVVRNGEEGTI